MIIRKTDRWFVGFVPAPNRGLWRLAHGPFGHCFAYRQTALGFLLVEQNVWGLDVRTVDYGVIDELLALCETAGALLDMPSRRRDFRWTAPPLLTCTTAIAALVGVRAWIVTPKQLYGALLERGATVVHPPHAQDPKG